MIRLIITIMLAALLTIAFLGIASAAPAPDSEPAIFADFVKSAIKDRLSSRFEGGNRNVESLFVTLPKNLQPPESFDRMEIGFPYASRAGSRLFVTIAMYESERLIKRFNATAKVEVSMMAAVATRDIPQGTVIKNDDIRMEKIILGKRFDLVINDPESIIGKVSDRKISVGKPIRSDRISTPKMVNSGDIVTVSARNEMLLITTSGRAKEDGNIGDSIRVMNVTSKKIFNAKVTAPGEVAIEF